jgi:activator of HSP90 ATPase
MKSLRVTATLDASCDFIYRFFLDSRLHADVTGSPAQIEGKAGGKFSAWDAYITGRNKQSASRLQYIFRQLLVARFF